MQESSYYFSFQSLLSKELFENSPLVWDVLKNLSAFLKKQVLGKIDISIPEGVFLENKELISIGEGTVLEPGCYIKGPALIGKNCEIRHGAYIRGDVILEDGSVVGHATEVKHSILLAGAHAAHFNYVGDSILGNRSNLGAGVICANFRLDKGEISVLIDGKKIETGLRKMGVILGDESQIGCNSVLSPGTLIGKRGICFPCTPVNGSFPSDCKIKDLKK